MRKIIIFFVVLILLVCAYCTRGYFLVPYLQKYMSSKTGHNISISTFSVSPFKLSIKNINADGIVKAKKVTFKLNLLKLFLSIFSSLENIRQIEISNLEINLKENPDTTDVKSNNRKSILNLPKMEVDVYIDKATIKQGSSVFNLSNINVYVNSSTINIGSNLHSLGSSIKIEASLKQKQDYLFDGSILLVSKDKMNMFITSEGTIDLVSFNANWNIVVVNLDYRGFDFEGASGTLLKNENGIDIKIGGNFGNLKVNGLLSDKTDMSAFIDISQTNKSMSGKLNIDFKKQRYSKELRIKSSKLKVFDFELVSFDLYGNENNNGAYKVICDCGSSRKLEGVYLKNGVYESSLFVRDKKVGNIKGNIKTGATIVDAKNISMIDMPIVPVMAGNGQGTIDIFGSIDENSGKIDFIFKNLEVSGMKRVNAEGAILRDRNKYIFNFCKSDNSISLKNVIVDGKQVFTDFKFERVNLSNVSRIIGNSKVNISGVADGHIKYESGMGTKFDIKAFNGKFYGNEFKEFNGKVEASLNRIDIKQFVIKNSSNTSIVDVKGLIGFTDENPKSSVYIDLNGILFQGIKTDAHIEFHGYFSNGKNVKGLVRAIDSKIGGVSFGTLEADANISTKKIKISNLKSDNVINALISANLKRNKIKCVIDFKDINIEGIYPGISGYLDASVKFSEQLTNPYIKVSSLLKKGNYLSKNFSLSSEFYYKNGIVEINKANIASDKTEIFLNGQYSNSGHLYLTVNNLNDKIINTLIGFTLPFKGELFGKGKVSFLGKNPVLNLSLETKGAYINSLKIKDFKAKVKIANKNIEISSASAKISNSEIRVDKGFYNLNNSKYSLDLFLLNIHAGPADLFGSIKVSGDMLKENGESVYSGIVNINNLWLNKYKLDHYLFNYSFKNGNLRLFQKSEIEKDKFDLSGKIIFSDTLYLKKLNVVKGSSYFDMSGSFSKEYINFEIAGFGIDWRFMANLFGLPGDPEGLADIHIKLKGKQNALEGKMSIVSSNGTFINVPFDKFGVYIDFYDSLAYIKEAVISKRNSVDISVSGSFPISFSDEEISKKLVTIKYEIEDNKLDSLDYLSDGLLSPLAGKMILKGHIEGSYKNLTSNGKLSIYNGAFKANDYINKIKNASIEMSLTDNLIKIDKFTFSSGSGEVNVDGQIKLKNFQVKNFNIRAFTEGNKGIPIYIPMLPITKFMGSKSILKDYSYGEPLFDIKMSGNLENPLVSGYIILENTRFTFPGESDKNSNFAIPPGTEFDLDLRTGANTRFENSFVSALINGSLHIGGNIDSLKPEGTIDLTSGKLNFGIGSFDIISSKLEIFSDNKVYITAEGETIIPSKTGGDSETIKVHVMRSELLELLTGEINDAISFSSKDNPNMDPQKAFAKAMGTDQEKEINSSEFEASPNFRAKQQVLRRIDQNFSTPLAKLFFRKIGVADNFKVSYVSTDDTISNNDTLDLVYLLSGTRYTMEKNLSKNILLGYNLTFDEFNKKLGLRHDIELRYRLAPDLFLKGNFEFDPQEGTRNPDRSIMFQHQFRFGPSKKHKKQVEE
ncbi:MAG: translocation/assembly module TamB [Endomicrobium sp.]|nr:translocation/assembly module TamB [Endomicrobium sp.]